MESSLREDLLLKTVSLLELHKAQGMMPQRSWGSGGPWETQAQPFENYMKRILKPVRDSHPTPKNMLKSSPFFRLQKETLFGKWLNAT